MLAGGIIALSHYNSYLLYISKLRSNSILEVRSSEILSNYLSILLLRCFATNKTMAEFFHLDCLKSHSAKQHAVKKYNG